MSFGLAEQVEVVDQRERHQVVGRLVRLQVLRQPRLLERQREEDEEEGEGGEDESNRAGHARESIGSRRARCAETGRPVARSGPERRSVRRDAIGSAPPVRRPPGESDGPRRRFEPRDRLLPEPPIRLRAARPARVRPGHWPSWPSRCSRSPVAAVPSGPLRRRESWSSWSTRCAPISSSSTARRWRSRPGSTPWDRSPWVERAFSPASWTRPSLPSLFTGLYPSEHGLTDFVGSAGQYKGAVLSEVGVTLAEEMQAAGRRTAMVGYQTLLSARFGMAQGFDFYNNNTNGGERIRKRFLEWFDEAPGQPFFAYLHYLDIHWPYCPPRADLGQRSTRPPNATITCDDWRGLRERDPARARWCSPRPTAGRSPRATPRR